MTLNNNFDFGPYMDGWNGIKLVENENVKKDVNEKVYCKEKYAQSALKKYDESFGKFGYSDETSKDLEPGSIVYLKNLTLVGKDEVIGTTTVGSDVIINLAKENKFFESFGMTKSEFKNDVFSSNSNKQDFLDKKYPVMIDEYNHASLSDGLLYKTKQEFLEQISLGENATKAYSAHIDSLNKGGYIVTIQGIKAFLPGSLAAVNKISDFSTLLDKDVIVMIECYDNKNGFIVSVKRYYTHIMPQLMDKLRNDFDTTPEKIYEGTVTGTKYFGIFIEFGNFFNGLLYKKYASEKLLADLSENKIITGNKISVYIHDFIQDKNGNERIVLSDVPAEEREKLIKVRDAEKEKKEREYMEEHEKIVQMHETEKKEYAEQHMKKFQKEANVKFSGKTISSFEELKS